MAKENSGPVDSSQPNLSDSELKKSGRPVSPWHIDVTEMLMRMQIIGRRCFICGSGRPQASLLVICPHCTKKKSLTET